MNQDEAKLAYADVFMCKITIHIKIVNPQEATVYINCIMIENLPSLLDQYKPLWLIGISRTSIWKTFKESAYIYPEILYEKGPAGRRCSTVS